MSTSLPLKTLGCVSMASWVLACRVPVTQSIPEAYSCANSGSTSTCVWIIQQPNVTQRYKDYPDIRFEPGDVVRVTAGGCVNVGTRLSHSSWHPYVRPISDGVERLYYATIMIPGVTIGFEPLRSLANRGSLGDSSESRSSPTFQIPAVVDSSELRQLYLRLGWVDRELSYRDNGYAGWSERDASSCKSTNPYASAAVDEGLRYSAWVRVEVRRNNNSLNDVAARQRLAASQNRLHVLALNSASDVAHFLSDSIGQVGANAVVPGTKEFNAFDLATDSLDPNGFPMNPQWGWAVMLHRFGGERRPDGSNCDFSYNIERHVWGLVSRGLVLAGPRLPHGCTSQGSRLTIDESKGIKNAWCGSTGQPSQFHGHINWFPATYEGRVQFSHYAEDRDVNLELWRSDLAGQTAYNEGQRLHVEFNRDETVAHFTTPWWRKFANDQSRFANDVAVRRLLNDDARPIEMLSPTDGKLAVITGLLGLDAVHNAQAEIHPAFAVAIQTQAALPGTDNVWQVFVRNEGNEGECAQEQHFLDLPDEVFRLSLPIDPELGTHITADTHLYSIVDGLGTGSGRTSPGKPAVRIQPECYLDSYRRRVVLKIPLKSVQIDSSGVRDRAIVFGDVRLKPSAAGQSVCFPK